MANAPAIGAFVIKATDWTVRANFVCQFVLHPVTREIALRQMYARAIEAMI